MENWKRCSVSEWICIVLFRTSLDAKRPNGEADDLQHDKTENYILSAYRESVRTHTGKVNHEREARAADTNVAPVPPPFSTPDGTNIVYIK